MSDKRRYVLFFVLAIALVALFGVGTTAQAQTVDLILTGVIDGPLTLGTPKVVEFYVINDIPDLSIYGFGSANNGGGSDGEEFTFPADAATAGSFIYVATEVPQFTAWFGFAPNYTSGATAINGDDAIELFQNGSVVDVFGDINVDGTGQPWEYMDGWAYRVDGTGPDGTTFMLANWTFSGPNALDGESSNGTAATPFPTGSYAPGGGGDSAPVVSSTVPGNGAANVAVAANIDVNFNEAVTVTGSWFEISCANSGLHTAVVSGGPQNYTLNPDTDFDNSETCTVTVFASQVTDVDTDDPPDNMNSDFVWSFDTESLPIAGVVINEFQADPASDLTGDANGDGVRDFSDDEFIEIVNASGGDLDISGWTLADGYSVRHTFPAGTTIPDSCSAVVFGGGTPTGVFGGSVVQTASGGSLGLSNGGDTITLSDGANNLIYVYGSEGGYNQSLTRDPDITGADPLVEHSTATGSGGALFSPGTMIDGSPFAGCALPVSIFDIQFTADPGGDSPYNGQKVKTQGVVTAVFGNNVFIQDGTGPWNGILLFTPSIPLAVGDLVEVTGSVSEFFNKTEIAFGDVAVLSAGNPLPAPELLSTGAVPQEQWESVLVRVENATVTNDNLGFGEWLIDDTSGGVRVDDLGSYTYAPTNGDLLDFVQGPLDFSFSNFKIQPRGDTDVSFTPPPPPVLSIMEIQGSGQFSAYDSQIVETSGIVTLFTANGFNCWIQDPVGDGNPATSDGIYVDDCGSPDQGDIPSVGDIIRVIGQVEERQFGNALPLTRLRAAAFIEVLSSGNPLPPPILISDLPNESIPDGIAFWESLEGMMVQVKWGRPVAATSRFGEFAMVTRTDGRRGSGIFRLHQNLLIRSIGDELVDYNPERIIVDDSSLADPIIVNLRDRIWNLTGVVDYTFGNYKLQPISYHIRPKGLPSIPAGRHDGPLGNTVITTFNVENLFDLVDNPDKSDGHSTPTPEELETQLTKLAMAIELELRLPEIIIVQEVENTAILQELGNRVNTAAGTNYVATSFETSDARGIEVGFLWDDNRVDLLNAFQMAGPDVEAAFGPTSASPGREPLVGAFDIDGYEITIIGNHFKSKGGDDPLFGVNWPPIRATEVQRKLQAHVVRDYANQLLSANPDALVMVTGDLNDFPFAEPGEGSDHPVGILEGGAGEIPLTNLISREKAADRYTFVFDGNSQVLDHMLVSPALNALVRDVDILHFNAVMPAYLSSDPTTTLRASDHDPIEARFRLR